MQSCHYLRTYHSSTGNPLAASGRPKPWLPAFEKPGLRGRVFNEEPFWVDREPHPDISVRVASPHETYRLVDALSLNRCIDSGSSVTHLD
jgi:hypothetical protein